MKTIKVVTEFEVPNDFNDNEALVQFVNGTMDNAPEPRDIDLALKNIEMGVCYIE